MENCPHCDTCLRTGPILSRVDSKLGFAVRGWSVDGPIPYYGPDGELITEDGLPCFNNLGEPLHSWNTIGVSVRFVYDGTLFWECPACGGRWHRFEPGHRLYDKAIPYVAVKREQKANP